MPVLTRHRTSPTPTAAPAPTRSAPVQSGPRRARDDLDARVRTLVTRIADLPADDPDRPRLRDRVVEMLIPMAEQLARRFQHRGEPLEDLVQVACVGLLKAVDGYDCSRDNEFTSYAVPTIAGELKRYFRDKGWTVRVPRRLQELKLEIARATDALTQQLGRSPTVVDLARHLHLEEEEVIAGLNCAHAYSALSLHTPVSGDDSGTEMGDLLGDVDHDLDGVEDREALRPMIARLPRREQRILAMRFSGNMTQSQIAAEIGISQMHVSRLLSGALARLRGWLVAEA